MATNVNLPSDVRSKQPELNHICARFRVNRLELFGSGVTGRFDPKTSDLDFLVEFQNMDPAAYADAYFGLLEALQELFGRSVDVVVNSAITNPYLRQKVEGEKALLYAA